jgi:hypothetical protein
MNSASQSIPAPSDVTEAAAQLDAIEAGRSASVRLAGAVWFPLLIGGIANIAAPSVTALIGGPAAPAWYWSFAGPFIGIACAGYYASRPVQLPHRVSLISVLVAIAMGVGALALGIGLAESAGGAPVLAVAAGLGAFAVLYRSAHVGLVAASHLVGALVMFSDASDRTAHLVFLSVGALSCVVALAALLTTHHPDKPLP